MGHRQPAHGISRCGTNRMMPTTCVPKMWPITRTLSCGRREGLHGVQTVRYAYSTDSARPTAQVAARVQRPNIGTTSLGWGIQKTASVVGLRTVLQAGQSRRRQMGELARTWCWSLLNTSLRVQAPWADLNDQHEPTIQGRCSRLARHCGHPPAARRPAPARLDRIRRR